MSKGSSPRPFSVTREQFGAQFDAIFGKHKPADTQERAGQAAPAGDSKERSEHERTE